MVKLLPLSWFRQTFGSGKIPVARTLQLSQSNARMAESFPYQYQQACDSWVGQDGVFFCKNLSFLSLIFVTSFLSLVFVTSLWSGLQNSKINSRDNPLGIYGGMVRNFHAFGTPRLLLQNCIIQRGIQYNLIRSRYEATLGYASLNIMFDKPNKITNYLIESIF